MAAAKKVQLPSWVNELSQLELLPLTPEQEERVNNAKKFAKEITDKIMTSAMPFLAAQQKLMQQNQQSAINPQTYGIFCRLYIGSLNFDINERHLRAVFGVFGHIKVFNLAFDPQENRHKGFCFLEYDTPEAATMACDQMDGALMGGRPIKVGRPNNYPADGPRKLPQPPKSRIYVSNIHELVSENDLRDIFESFGNIIACVMPPDSQTKKHKTFAYIQYQEAEDANMALMAMNGFELGSQQIKVTKCVLGGPLPEGMNQGGRNVPKAVLEIAQEINKSVEMNQNVDVLASNSSLIDIEEERKNINGKVSSIDYDSDEMYKDSKVLLFLNMIGSDEEVDQDLYDEIKEECEKEGRVEQIKIKKVQGEWRVFVSFETKEASDRVKLAINGRWFAGRKVVVKKYPKQMFLDDILNE